MKTIKIIDLLCYISIGDYDKIPKKVKWRDDVWEYDDRMQDYTNGHLILFEQLKIIRTKEFLNDEVEVIDEEDEFEDIESFGVNYSWDYIDYKNIEELKKYVNKDFQNIFNTLDKLIKNQKKIIERLQNENSKNNV